MIGRDVTVAKMIEEVEKDRAYYRRSGGGITLSGGESLCQPEFSQEIFSGQQKNVESILRWKVWHVLPGEQIEQILPYLDLYLMDIKHMNPGET